MKIKYQYTRKSYRSDENILIEKENEWKRSEFYCPLCGKKKVIYTTSFDYFEDNAGDQFVCMSCGYGFKASEGKSYTSIPADSDFLSQARLAFGEEIDEHS